MSAAPATAARLPLRRERPAPVHRRAPRYRTDGTVLGEVELDPEVFGLEPNVAVMHQVVTAQLAAARAGTQSTRTRAEVSGGGAKPFRQKGTGRARQGSIRAPQWTGGGIALGPKPRDYRQRTPKKMVRLALRSALSDRAGEGRIAVVDRWTFEVPRTKEAVSVLEALGLAGRILVVVGPEDVVAERSFANLPRVQVLPASELNTYDVLRSDWVLFTDATLPGTNEQRPAPVADEGRRAGSAPADAAPDEAGPADASAPEGTDASRDGRPADGEEGSEG